MSEPTPTPAPTPTPDPVKDLETARAEMAKLKAELDSLKAKKEAPAEDPSLADKVRKQKEDAEKAQSDQKKIEAAIKFDVAGRNWAKSNASLLPKTIDGIFDAADKENYGSAIEKVATIKMNIVSEFFAQQANLDLLTESQKNQVEEFKKLTKTDKQDRAGQIFDSIFEPTLESLKKITKAKILADGHSTPTDAEAAYKEKLIAGSKKHYNIQ